jgi:hypothetical protein
MVVKLNPEEETSTLIEIPDITTSEHLVKHILDTHKSPKNIVQPDHLKTLMMYVMNEYVTSKIFEFSGRNPIYSNTNTHYGKLQKVFPTIGLDHIYNAVPRDVQQIILDSAIIVCGQRVRNIDKRKDICMNADPDDIFYAIEQVFIDLDLYTYQEAYSIIKDMRFVLYAVNGGSTNWMRDYIKKSFYNNKYYVICDMYLIVMRMCSRINASKSTIDQQLQLSRHYFGFSDEEILGALSYIRDVITVHADTSFFGHSTIKLRFKLGMYFNNCTTLDAALSWLYVIAKITIEIPEISTAIKRKIIGAVFASVQYVNDDDYASVYARILLQSFDENTYIHGVLEQELDYVLSDSVAMTRSDISNIFNALLYPERIGHCAYIGTMRRRKYIRPWLKNECISIIGLRREKRHTCFHVRELSSYTIQKIYNNTDISMFSDWLYPDNDFVQEIPYGHSVRLHCYKNYAHERVAIAFECKGLYASFDNSGAENIIILADPKILPRISKYLAFVQSEECEGFSWEYIEVPDKRQKEWFWGIDPIPPNEITPTVDGVGGGGSAIHVQV